MKNCISMRAAPSRRVLTTPALFWEKEIHGYFIHAAPHGLIARFPFDALCYLILYSYFKKKNLSRTQSAPLSNSRHHLPVLHPK